MTDLGVDWTAHSINDSGQVVGSKLTGGEQMHAVFWEDGVLTDLNDLLPPGSGWELQEARDINDNGGIVGWGSIEGQVHAFCFALTVDACWPPASFTSAAGDSWRERLQVKSSLFRIY
jgi:probable HAF family extracellular repeat protein